ncbi:MAG TPA: cupin domain-containing protein [Baekduia sp.]|nr:cupin domain-containing protein [Baekduia sp.]
MPQTVRRTDGESITDRERREVRILAAGDESLTVTWSRYAQGERGPDLHIHREHTDAFYVLSGTVTYILGAEGERVERASAGTVVVVGADVPHAFRNDDEADAVFLNAHAPDAGFAAYMRDLRDGAPASFDSYDLPVAGTRPAGEAALVAPGAGEPDADGGLVRYDGADLHVVERGDAIELSVPGGAAIVFVR